MSEQILISGGRVIDQTGERRADVRVLDGRVAEVAPSIEPVDADEVLDATAVWSVPDSSISTRICVSRDARRRRRSRPDRGRRRAVGTRVSWRCRTPIRRRIR